MDLNDEEDVDNLNNTEEAIQVTRADDGNKQPDNACAVRGQLTDEVRIASLEEHDRSQTNESKKETSVACSDNDSNHPTDKSETGSSGDVSDQHRSDKSTKETSQEYKCHSKNNESNDTKPDTNSSERINDVFQIRDILSINEATSISGKSSPTIDVPRSKHNIETTYLDLVDGLSSSAGKSRSLSTLPSIEEGIEEDSDSSGHYPHTLPSTSSSLSSLPSSANLFYGNVVQGVSSKPTLTSITEETRGSSAEDVLDLEQMGDDATNDVDVLENVRFKAVPVHGSKTDDKINSKEDIHLFIESDKGHGDVPMGGIMPMDIGSKIMDKQQVVDFPGGEGCLELQSKIKVDLDIVPPPSSDIVVNVVITDVTDSIPSHGHIIQDPQSVDEVDVRNDDDGGGDEERTIATGTGRDCGEGNIGDTVKLCTKAQNVSEDGTQDDLPVQPTPEVDGSIQEEVQYAQENNREGDAHLDHTTTLDRQVEDGKKIDSASPCETVAESTRENEGQETVDEETTKNEGIGSASLLGDFVSEQCYSDLNKAICLGNDLTLEASEVDERTGPSPQDGEDDKKTTTFSKAKGSGSDSKVNDTTSSSCDVSTARESHSEHTMSSTNSEKQDKESNEKESQKQRDKDKDRDGNKRKRERGVEEGSASVEVKECLKNAVGDVCDSSKFSSSKSVTSGPYMCEIRGSDTKTTCRLEWQITDVANDSQNGENQMDRLIQQISETSHQIHDSIQESDSVSDSIKQNKSRSKKRKNKRKKKHVEPAAKVLDSSCQNNTHASNEAETDTLDTSDISNCIDSSLSVSQSDDPISPDVEENMSQNEPIASTNLVFLVPESDSSSSVPLCEKENQEKMKCAEYVNVNANQEEFTPENGENFASENETLTAQHTEEGLLFVSPMNSCDEPQTGNDTINRSLLFTPIERLSGENTSIETGQHTEWGLAFKSVDNLSGEKNAPEFETQFDNDTENELRFETAQSNGEFTSLSSQGLDTFISADDASIDDGNGLSTPMHILNGVYICNDTVQTTLIHSNLSDERETDYHNLSSQSSKREERIHRDSDIVPDVFLLRNIDWNNPLRKSTEGDGIHPENVINKLDESETDSQNDLETTSSLLSSSNAAFPIKSQAPFLQDHQCSKSVASRIVKIPTEIEYEESQETSTPLDALQVSNDGIGTTRERTDESEDLQTRDEKDEPFISGDGSVMIRETNEEEGSPWALCEDGEERAYYAGNERNEEPEMKENKCDEREEKIYRECEEIIRGVVEVNLSCRGEEISRVHEEDVLYSQSGNAEGERENYQYEYEGNVCGEVEHNVRGDDRERICEEREANVYGKDKENVCEGSDGAIPGTCKDQICSEHDTRLCGEGKEMVSEGVKDDVWGKDKDSLHAESEDNLCGWDNDSLHGESEDNVCGKDKDTLRGENEDNVCGGGKLCLHGESEDNVCEMDKDSMRGESEDNVCGEDNDYMSGKREDTVCGKDKDTLRGESEENVCEGDKYSMRGESEDNVCEMDKDSMRGESEDNVCGEDNDYMSGKREDTVCGKDKDTLRGESEENVCEGDKYSMRRESEDNVCEGDKESNCGESEDNVSEGDKESKRGECEENVSERDKGTMSGESEDTVCGGGKVYLHGESEGNVCEGDTYSMRGESEENVRERDKDTMRGESEDSVCEGAKVYLHGENKDNVCEGDNDSMRGESEENVSERDKDTMSGESEGNVYLHGESEDNVCEEDKDSMRGESEDSVRKRDKGTMSGESEDNICEGDNDSMHGESEENVRERDKGTMSGESDDNVCEMDKDSVRGDSEDNVCGGGKVYLHGEREDNVCEGDKDSMRGKSEDYVCEGDNDFICGESEDNVCEIDKDSIRGESEDNVCGEIKGIECKEYEQSVCRESEGNLDEECSDDKGEDSEYIAYGDSEKNAHGEIEDNVCLRGYDTMHKKDEEIVLGEHEGDLCTESKTYSWVDVEQHEDAENEETAYRGGEGNVDENGEVGAYRAADSSKIAKDGDDTGKGSEVLECTENAENICGETKQDTMGGEEGNVCEEGDNMYGDGKENVCGDGEESLCRDCKENVCGDGEESLRGDCEQTVGGDGEESLRGDCEENVRGDGEESLSGDCEENVCGDGEESLRGDCEESVSGDGEAKAYGDEKVNEYGVCGDTACDDRGVDACEETEDTKPEEGEGTLCASEESVREDIGHNVSEICEDNLCEDVEGTVLCEQKSDEVADQIQNQQVFDSVQELTGLMENIPFLEHEPESKQNQIEADLASDPTPHRDDSTDEPDKEKVEIESDMINVRHVDDGDKDPMPLITMNVKQEGDSVDEDKLRNETLDSSKEQKDIINTIVIGPGGEKANSNSNKERSPGTSSKYQETEMDEGETEAHHQENDACDSSEKNDPESEVVKDDPSSYGRSLGNACDSSEKNDPESEVVKDDPSSYGRSLGNESSGRDETDEPSKETCLKDAHEEEDGPSESEGFERNELTTSEETVRLSKETDNRDSQEISINLSKSEGFEKIEQTNGSNKETILKDDKCEEGGSSESECCEQTSCPETEGPSEEASLNDGHDDCDPKLKEDGKNEIVTCDETDGPSEEETVQPVRHDDDVQYADEDSFEEYINSLVSPSVIEQKTTEEQHQEDAGDVETELTVEDENVETEKDEMEIEAEMKCHDDEQKEYKIKPTSINDYTIVSANDPKISYVEPNCKANVTESELDVEISDERNESLPTPDRVSNAIYRLESQKRDYTEEFNSYRPKAFEQDSCPLHSEDNKDGSRMSTAEHKTQSDDSLNIDEKEHQDNSETYEMSNEYTYSITDNQMLNGGTDGQSCHCDDEHDKQQANAMLSQSGCGECITDRILEDQLPQTCPMEIQGAEFSETLAYCPTDFRPLDCSKEQQECCESEGSVLDSPSGVDVKGIEMGGNEDGFEEELVLEENHPIEDTSDADANQEKHLVPNVIILNNEPVEEYCDGKDEAIEFHTDYNEVLPRDSHYKEIKEQMDDDDGEKSSKNENVSVNDDGEAYDLKQSEESTDLSNAKFADYISSTEPDTIENDANDICKESATESIDSALDIQGERITEEATVVFESADVSVKSPDTDGGETFSKYDTEKATDNETAGSNTLREENFMNTFVDVGTSDIKGDELVEGVHIEPSLPMEEKPEEILELIDEALSGHVGPTDTFETYDDDDDDEFTHSPETGLPNLLSALMSDIFRDTKESDEKEDTMSSEKGIDELADGPDNETFIAPGYSEGSAVPQRFEKTPTSDDVLEPTTPHPTPEFPNTDSGDLTSKDAEGPTELDTEELKRAKAEAEAVKIKLDAPSSSKAKPLWRKVVARLQHPRSYRRSSTKHRKRAASDGATGTCQPEVGKQTVEDQDEINDDGWKTLERDALPLTSSKRRLGQNKPAGHKSEWRRFRRLKRMRNGAEMVPEKLTPARRPIGVRNSHKLYMGPHTSFDNVDNDPPGASTNERRSKGKTRKKRSDLLLHGHLKEVEIAGEQTRSFTKTDEVFEVYCDQERKEVSDLAESLANKETPPVRLLMKPLISGMSAQTSREKANECSTDSKEGTDLMDDTQRTKARPSKRISCVIM